MQRLLMIPGLSESLELSCLAQVTPPPLTPFPYRLHTFDTWSTAFGICFLSLKRNIAAIFNLV